MVDVPYQICHYLEELIFQSFTITHFNNDRPAERLLAMPGPLSSSIAQNSFFGQPVQQMTQDPFLELMQSQREILKRLEQLESQTKNSHRKW